MHRALVDQARQGDVEAFGTLARLVGDRCMAIAFRILRDVDLADEAAQAALVQAWRELPSLRDPDRFEPWLHRILTNECYEMSRQRRRWSPDIRVLPMASPSDSTDILTVDDRDQLTRWGRPRRAIAVDAAWTDAATDADLVELQAVIDSIRLDSPLATPAPQPAPSGG